MADVLCKCGKSNCNVSRCTNSRWAILQTELQCRNKYSVCKCLYDFITYKVDKRNNAARHLPLKSPVKNWMYKEIEDEQVTGVRIHCKKPWIEIYLNTCNWLNMSYNFEMSSHDVKCKKLKKENVS